MKDIIRGFKKWMLRVQIRRCELMLIKLGAKTDRYHKIILKSIEEGNKVKTKKLQLKRDEYADIHMATIRKKHKLKRLLIGA